VKHRLRWDKQVKSLTETALGNQQVVVKKQVNCGVLNMNAKEFLDK
jgi:hypothetical protein